MVRIMVNSQDMIKRPSAGRLMGRSEPSMAPYNLGVNSLGPGTPEYHDGAVGQDPGATGYNNSQVMDIHHFSLVR